MNRHPVDVALRGLLFLAIAVIALCVDSCLGQKPRTSEGPREAPQPKRNSASAHTPRVSGPIVAESPRSPSANPPPVERRKVEQIKPREVTRAPAPLAPRPPTGISSFP